LVNNAIKHHDRPNGRVRISATEFKDMVEFTVADDGPGIDPAFHERIFQMFQTLRPRDQVEGSGIGLAVVEKIVSSVGGTISVESTPENGATFRFTWPRELKS
jgi:signal transduction histidine kinase